MRRRITSHTAEGSVLNRTATASLIYGARRKDIMEVGVEDVKAGERGGALGNAVFKTGHGCYTHK